jgi:hypothetical protein
MRYWFYFWTIAFLTAGSAFAVIAAVVLVGGIGDLRRMLAELRKRE